ncbi:unnamed protein product, partial [Rotaria magnacalcarata]
TSSQSLSTSNSNNENYKNEFHLEIPVTITTSNDQENQSELINETEDGINNYERILSENNNSNQALKSILKRSSSRETVSRKNIYSMVMSRRKQRHPKSLKEGDKILFDLPNELEFDEDVSYIKTKHLFI